MPTTPKDTSLSKLNFYYNQQFERYIVQFMAIFSGLHVQFGIGQNNTEPQLVPVPITYGSRDRLVEAIKNEFTQNKLLRLPTMSAHQVGAELALDRLKGVGQHIRDVKLPRGGSIPEDLFNAENHVALPIRMRLELHMAASNTNQHLQMLEQILVLFDPVLQIQTDEDALNPTKVALVELEGINFEENYPIGENRRFIISTLAFNTVAYIAVPVNLKDEIVNTIRLRIDTVAASDDVEAVVCDMTRDTPYEDLFSANDLNIPEN